MINGYPIGKYVFLWIMAGVVGFEPTIHGTKNRCLTTWLHPNGERLITRLVRAVQEPSGKKKSDTDACFSTQADSVADLVRGNAPEVRLAGPAAIASGRNTAPVRGAVAKAGNHAQFETRGQRRGVVRTGVNRQQVHLDQHRAHPDSSA